MTYDEVGDGYS